MSGVVVLACKTEDFNASTGQCAAPFYTFPPTSVLPAMTMDGAMQISLAIGLLWATAWGIRRAKKMLDQM